MSQTDRQLVLTLGGPAVEDAKIPFSILAMKMDALQKALYNVALAGSGGPVAQRGNWSKQIRASCELLFCETRKGSLSIVSEIPPALPIQRTLFGEVSAEDADLGLNALQSLKKVVKAIEVADSKKLVSIMPDSSARARALKSIEMLCPRESDDFWVALGSVSGELYTRFTSDSGQFIQRMFENEDVIEIQSISGDLVEIRVLAGRRHIVVRSHQKEITCYYANELEETISQLVAGSIIEVRGKAQVGEDGLIRQIDEILDISSIDLSPFRTSSFKFENRHFILKEPVMCTLEYRNNLWIYECPRFGLHAFAEDRREALRQLREEFAFLVDGLMNEPDDALTQDAKELQDLLKNDLKNIEEL